jgi:RNA-directed DNA polymerase
VPIVADRIAQTVAAMYLELKVEPMSTRTPTGTGRVVRRWTRWRRAGSVVGGPTGWSILTSKGSSTDLDHDLVVKAVAHHLEPGRRWILLYVKWWLKAPLQKQDGTLVGRDRGSPQGSAISPFLANRFMHYALDAWMARQCPGVRFERYCDDGVIHC